MQQKILPFGAVHPTVETLYGQHGRRSSLIYSAVLLALLLGLALLPFIQVTVSSQAAGMIRTEQANNAITVGIGGQLTRLHVVENTVVQQGDTLLELSVAHLDEQLRYRQQQSVRIERCLHDLSLLLADPMEGSLPALQTDIYRQEWLQYQQQLRELEVKCDYADNHYARQELLFQSGSIARVAFEQATFERDMAWQALQRLRQQQRQQWESHRRRYRDEQAEAATLARQLRQQRRQHLVLAPIAGTITQVGGWQAGNFVAAGQTVAHIAPTGKLRVLAYLSPSDIGQVRVGMPVQFQIDAFNHHQWGLARGCVMEIAPDIITIDGQPVFGVHCSLEKDFLQLPNGYVGRLKKGMTLRANFLLSRRTLLQLLYDTAEDWLDPRN